jgi:branched-chain amino acid transport system substrate-binding protein
MMPTCPLALACALCAALLLTGCPKNPEAVNPPTEGVPTQPEHPPRPTQPRAQIRQDPAADEALAQAERQAANVPPARAPDVYLQVYKTYPETTSGEEALYRAGSLYFDAGQYEKARAAFDNLLFENPLFPRAQDAQLRLGEAELKTGEYRDAYQLFSQLQDKVPPELQARVFQDSLAAASGAGMTNQALQLAVNAVADARTPQDQADALDRLTTLIEEHATFLDIARVQQDTSTSSPAWPVLTFKLARIYYHLRDWDRLTETLQRFLQQAPQSPYAQEAQQMLARVNRRATVSPRTIGVLLPMSGKYQPFGEAVMRGIKLALDGSDLEVVVKDTQGDVTLAANAVEQLAFDSGAIAAIGPLLTDDSRRAAVVSEELGLPIITMTRSEDVTQIGPHVFRNMLTNSAQAEAVAQWATKTMGYKSFAVMYPNIPYGTELANDFWDAALDAGGEIRGAETYANDQTTFSNEVKKLVGRYWLEDRADVKEQMKELEKSTLDPFHKHKAFEKLKNGVEPVVDFDALFIPDDWRRVGLIAPALAVEDIITNACDPKDVEKIKKTTGKDEIHTVTLIGSNQWNSPKGPDGVPELVQRGGKFVNCAVYVDGFYADSERGATKRFVRAYREAYKDQQRDPGLLEAIGYDTAKMLRAVIDSQKPQTREQLRDGLTLMKSFEGATGKTHFNDSREAVKPLFFLRIHNGKIEEINPEQPLASGR